MKNTPVFRHFCIRFHTDTRNRSHIETHYNSLFPRCCHRSVGCGALGRAGHRFQLGNGSKTHHYHGRRRQIQPAAITSGLLPNSQLQWTVSKRWSAAE